MLWCYAIIAALWLLSGEARRALGFVAVLAAVALAEWGAGFIPNATVAGMVGFLFFIFARSLSTFALIMWMSVGLRIDDLIASLQRLRLPRGLVITIAVVFRYLPTAADEFRKISATMRLRGVELSARNLVLHPGRSLEYVLVPLIIRTIKIADDLAASAMTRGLDLVGARTTYRDVRIGASGALVTAAVLVCTAAGYAHRSVGGARDGGGARLYGGRLCRVGGERAMTANEVVVAGATFRYAHDGQLRCAASTCARAGGKLVLLLGASGCGKTTATRLLNGLVPHFFEGGALDGSVDVCGMEPASVSVQRLAGAVGSVFQDPRSQFFATDVSSEIAFSCENLGVPALEMRRRVAEAAGACGVAHLMDRSIFDLSSGEKQAVAVASVLAMRPRVVVMDEPSANLDEVATARLRTIVETLLHRGVTVVVSEHRVHYLADLADEALLLRAGRVERRFAAGELARLTPEASHELGLRASSLDEVRAVPRAEARGPAVLEVRDVSFGYRGAPPVLKGTSFSVREGEVVGIVGRNGVGKSTLIDLVCGLKTECAGTVSIGGVALRPKERVRASYLVMQDSDCQLFAESVEAELLLGERADEARTARARAALARMGLAGLEDRHPASLSGGQKQRLSIAVAYMKDAKVVCLDEPTSGLDWASMMGVAQLLRDLAEEGRGIVVITHDYEFLLAACDRVLRIGEGGSAVEVGFDGPGDASALRNPE